MREKIKRTTCLLILCVLALEIRIHAQQARTGYTGFALTSPLEVSVGQDNNFLIDRLTNNERLFNLSLPPSVQRETALARPKKFSDQVVLLDAPTVSFLSDSPRREFAVNYRPEFEIFRQNSDQNAWNHDLSLGFAYLFTRTTEFFVGDIYRQTQ